MQQNGSKLTAAQRKKLKKKEREKAKKAARASRCAETQQHSWATIESHEAATVRAKSISSKCNAALYHRTNKEEASAGGTTVKSEEVRAIQSQGLRWLHTTPPHRWSWSMSLLRTSWRTCWSTNL